MSGPSRREVLGGLGAALAGCAPAPAPRPERPDIVLITLDQCNDLTWLDADRVDAPHLRALADAGTRFTASYCTSPACSPARSSWWTGRYPSETGVSLIGLPMAAHMPDLGALLRDEGGYDTVYLGKWHVEGREATHGFEHPSRGLNVGMGCDVPLATMARSLLAAPGGARPRFLTLNLLNPHDICVWRKGHRLLGGVDDGGVPEAGLPPLPPNFAARPREAALMGRARRRNTKDHDADFIRRFQWHYERYVEMVDGAVGAVLDALAATPRGRDTAVILTSDHGEAMGQHGLIFKTALYEAAARVPLVVSWPGRLPQGARVHEPVDGASLLPTICQLAGLAPPPGVLAPGLLPLIEGTGGGRGYAASQVLVEGRMIRTARYKYVAFKGDPVEQLFDLVDDPHELHELSQDPARAATLREHRALLAEWEAGLVEVPEAAAGYDVAAARARDEE